MDFSFKKTTAREILPLLRQHAQTLSSPWDSYMEENILRNESYQINALQEPAGYASVQAGQLFCFFVNKAYYSHAPLILQRFLGELKMNKVQVLTNDPLLNNLIMEWEYTLVSRNACFFSDAVMREMPPLQAQKPVFREALLSDMATIVQNTGDFFDSLENRIKKQTIFVLEDGGVLLGCGIVEAGEILTDCVSIGMITCREHRKKGVAGYILWHLKGWAYNNNLRPVAGCWYYNVLSRKSLEKAGMAATGKSFSVLLLEKKELPLRTGNPPGELAE